MSQTMKLQMSVGKRKALMHRDHLAFSSCTGMRRKMRRAFPETRNQATCEAERISLVGLPNSCPATTYICTACTPLFIRGGIWMVGCGKNTLYLECSSWSANCFAPETLQSMSLCIAD